MYRVQDVIARGAEPPAAVSPAVHDVELAGGAERSPILEHLFTEGRIGIVGGMYSVETGEVTFFEQAFQTPAPAAAMAAAR